MQTATFSKAMIKFWYKFHIQIQIQFIRGNSFLLTPFQPLPEKQENPLPTPLDTSTTALVSIFSSILNCSQEKQKYSIIKEWKYMSRELLKTIFCHQKTIKSRQALHEIFFNLQCKSGLLRGLSLHNIYWIFGRICISYHGCGKGLNLRY